jgi:protoporphyrinogen oxidase
MNRREFLARSLSFLATIGLADHLFHCGSGAGQPSSNVLQKGTNPSTVSGHAAVLGGGVAGLAAARTLAKKGWIVDVFEKNHDYGGFCSTLVIDGFNFDLGPHVFGRRIIGRVPFQPQDLDPVTSRESFFLYGKVLNFPADLLTEGFFLDTLLTLLKSPFLGDRYKGSDLEEMARTAYGEQATREIFKPLIEKWCSAPLNSLDARYMASRLHARVEMRTVMAFVKNYYTDLSKRLASEPDPNQASGRSSKAGPAQGIPQAPGYAGRIGARIVPDRLAQSSSNIRIHTNSPVTAIGIEKGHVAWIEAAGRSIRPDFAISTIPLNQLASIIRGRTRLEAVEGVDYLHVVFVFLRLARPGLVKTKWIWIPGSEIPFYRMSEMRSLHSRHAPKCCTGICLEVALLDKDPRLHKPDKYWKDLTAKFLADKFAVKPAEIIGIDIVKTKDAYPNFSKDNTARISRIIKRPYSANQRFHAFDIGIENLGLAGRAGTFIYLLTPEAISSGNRAAKQALKYMLHKEGSPKSQSVQLKADTHRA